MKLLQLEESIWVVENFLTKIECEDLIVLSESIGYQEAEVSLPSGGKMLKGIRNNSRILYRNIELANEYWQRLKPFCPEDIEGYTAIGLNEQFRFYKYESGQRFKKHVDGRFKRNNEEESRITFMIYLNEDFEGGETNFNQLNIKPVTGNALCFIHEQKHEGSSVKTGIKYVLRSDVMYKKK